MRQVDAEGDFQGNRNRKRSGARTSSASQKSHLRRLALEDLEIRTLMSASKAQVSTLPTPVTDTQIPLGGANGYVPPLTSTAANQSSPDVAVDPLNPLKLVAAWETYDPANPLDGSGGQVTTYAQAAFSIDGGATWTELTGDTDADIQPDFADGPANPQPNFPSTTDASVAFDRNENVYMLTSTHNAGSAAGVLNLQRWDFSTSTPAQATFTRGAFDNFSGNNTATTVNPIYRWLNVDAALTPTLAVDSNLKTFTEPATDATLNGSTTQTDAFAGNVYVAWETNDTAPKNTTINPHSIKLTSSSNEGQSFTSPVYLDSPFASSDYYDQPKIAISQGSASVPGGQVTVVYDDAGPGSTAAPYFDEVLSQDSTTGGTAESVNSQRNVGLTPATGTATPYNPGITSIPFNVNINDAKFTSLSNLTLTLSLTYPNLGATSAELVSPGGTIIDLWDESTNAAGTATGFGDVLSGANLGAVPDAPVTTPPPYYYVGTTLDSTALRSIFDGTASAPYTGTFRPAQNLSSQFSGDTAAQLNGTWRLVITSYAPQTTATTLVGATLNFTSGNSDIDSGNNGPNFVAQSFLNSSTHTYTGAIQAQPVLANPSIASDNTLGSNSTFQGRLYVAITNDNFNDITGAYTTSTFIELYVSDDGGTTWNPEGIVNDDNGLTDGFSTGGYATVQTPGGDLASDLNPGVDFFGNLEADVRPKIEPTVAVDQYTGTVVISYLDTRNDAAARRVATYIAASTDGGASFAPESYANPTSNADQAPVQDAVTGATVINGPIPDNESSGNFGSDGLTVSANTRAWPSPTA